MICPRCKDFTRAVTCSYFNTEDICLLCKAEEHNCPNFKRAYDAESDAVRAKNFNFQGIGLAPEDLAALATARGLRGKA